MRLLQQIITRQESTLAALDDLKAADTAIQSAVQAAVTLIESLHTNPSGVADADVEAVVADLNAAAAALGKATPQA